MDDNSCVLLSHDSIRHQNGNDAVSRVATFLRRHFFMFDSFSKVSDILAYAPRDAPARRELAAYRDFIDENAKKRSFGVAQYVLIRARDRQTMLRVAQLEAAIEVSRSTIEGAR